MRILLCLFLVGCATQKPAKSKTDFSQTIYVAPPVIVAPIVSQTKEEAESSQEEVLKTWITKEESEALMKAMQEAVERDSCKCLKGDPLCSCL